MADSNDAPFDARKRITRWPILRPPGPTLFVPLETNADRVQDLLFAVRKISESQASSYSDAFSDPQASNGEEVNRLLDRVERGAAEERVAMRNLVIGLSARP